MLCCNTACFKGIGYGTKSFGDKINLYTKKYKKMPNRRVICVWHFSVSSKSGPS